MIYVSITKNQLVIVSRYFGTSPVKRRLTRRKDDTLGASNGQKV
jgi:hypothetical protein